MRGILFGLCGIIIMALAFWAYQENYRTRQALRDVKQLHRQIGLEREALSVLNAEWAYLNRPARLRELAEINFERLGLLPLAPEHFGRVDQVAYPLVPPEVGALSDPVEVAGALAGSTLARSTLAQTQQGTRP